ncbi:MAG: hypothetical protein ABIH66_02235 [bacterium]
MTPCAMISSDQSLQVISLILTFIATIFLCKSILLANAKVISKLASTYWGENKTLLDSLCEQRADYSIGFVNLLLGIIFQLLSLAKLGIQTSLVYIVIGSALFFVLCYFCDVFLKRKYLKGVKFELFKEKLNDIDQEVAKRAKGGIIQSSANAFIQDARQFLNEGPNKNESEIDFINRLRSKHIPNCQPIAIVEP